MNRPPPGPYPPPATGPLQVLAHALAFFTSFGEYTVQRLILSAVHTQGWRPQIAIDPSSGRNR